jgi:hypothetical protein
MPFISQAYLKYLEEQFGGEQAVSASGAGAGVEPPDIPPANTGSTPSTAPDLNPGRGGPGSYPETPPQWPPGGAINPGPNPTPPPNPFTPPPPPGGGSTDLPGPNEPLLPPPPGGGTVNVGDTENVTGGGNPPGAPRATPAPPIPRGAYDLVPPPFNWGGWGEPMGYFNPGTYHPPGTGGIVNANMPAGGGYFGGHAGPLAFQLPGATYNLGGAGGNLSNPFQVFRGIHSPGFESWLQQNHPNMNPSTFWHQFSPPAGENSGAGASGAGRPQTVSR